MNSFLIVKYKFLKESSQLLLVQSSGTRMLGIDKDHSLNSASLDGTNVFFMLVKCVFHDVIIKLFVLFFKEKLLLYLMFCLIGTLY